MEQISNAEKQARYRRKELLKRKGNELFQKWQLWPRKQGVSAQEVQMLIDKAIELPSGWTEEDYRNAEIKLFYVENDLNRPGNQITNELHEGVNFSKDFQTLPYENLSNLMANFKESEKRTYALASHIISALRLSGCTELEQSSALMEAIRFVGLALVMDNKAIPCSDSTVIALASIGSHYERPDWFIEKLGSTITKQINTDRAQQLGNILLKGKK